MPGSNCAIYGCSTSRKDEDVGIFKLPTAKNPETAKWRSDIFNIITRDRVLDNHLKELFSKDKVYICEKHFKEEDMWHYVTKKTLKEFVLPTQNLPRKSISPRAPIQPRESSTSSIAKREENQKNQQESKLNTVPPPCYADLSDLCKRVVKLKLVNWQIYSDQSSYLTLVKNDSIHLLPMFEIITNSSLEITLRYFTWTIPPTHPFLQNFKTFKAIHVSQFIKMLESYQICKGIDLVEFKNAYHMKMHMVPKVIDYRNTSQCNGPLNQTEYLRSPNCPIFLSDGEKCSKCSAFEITFRSQENLRNKNLQTPAHRNAPLSFTSHEKLVVTVQTQRVENKLLKAENIQLQERLQAAIQQNSFPVDQGLNDDLVDIFKGVPASKVPPFMRLFWQEQQKYIRCKHKSQIRYHPAIIKFCLSISAKSSAAYKQLRLDNAGDGILVLPSERTLRDYRNYIRPQIGFNPEVVKDLAEKTKGFSDPERYISIIIDEMKIQEDLVWNKSTGELIGYLDLGDDDINQGILQDEQKLASHIMVFMVKSIMNPLSYSFATFATSTATSEQIYPLFWKAVAILEISVNLKVICTVSDGASTNRKFIKMNLDSETTCNGIVYKTKNIFASEVRYLFFFADPPHLIKTSRNCLWKSGSDGSSRFMWNDGLYLLWKHVKDMYNESLEYGLKLTPKLTANHIMLNSYSVMRVNYASQVLSETVANTLEEFGPPEAAGTAKFCSQMDKFFDCMNSRNTVEGEKKLKPYLEPYKMGNLKDRFDFLDSFLKYFDDWKASIDKRGDFTPTQKGNMFISVPTYEGLKMTVYSLKEIIPYLLKNGFVFVLSERFCQDDLENHFGRQRAIGHRKDNPTANDAIYNENIIRTQYDPKPIEGANVKKNKSTYDISDAPLKKRK